MAKNLERELPCLTSLLRGCKRKIHPNVMTGNGQLKRGAFIINDFLRNPYFKSLARNT